MSFADLVAAADRAVQGHLGSVTVTYQPEVGSAVLVQGMWNEGYVLLDQGEAGVEQLGPSVFLRLEDLPTDPMVDTPILTIEGQDYQVRDRQPDGAGGIRLVLHLA
jgi:hypothetical protein